MTTRFRSTLTLALLLGAATFATPRSAAAQDASLTPATAAPAVATQSAPVAGPTMEAASVAVRHAAPATTATPPRRAGYGQPVALMVVGGAAVLAGLIIGGGAGTAIAVGGAVVGLVGLYQYLQ
jgi:hypothetical protein